MREPSNTRRIRDLSLWSALALMVCALFSCAGSVEDQTDAESDVETFSCEDWVPERHEIDETFSPPASFVPLSACDLVGLFRYGAGIYTVDAIYTETGATQCEQSAITEIHFSLEVPWSDGLDETLIMRQPGGPYVGNDIYEDGFYTAIDFTVERGERVGMLIGPPVEGVYDTPFTVDAAVFRPAGERYTNGVLMLDDEDAATELFRTLYRDLDGWDGWTYNQGLDPSYYELCTVNAFPSDG